MDPSDALKGFIKVRESCRLQPHLDTVASRPGAPVYDIGWGHVYKPGEPRVPITQEEADALFDIDILYYSDQVNQALTVELPSQWMFDALVSFCYNLGGGAMATSTVIAYCNAEQYLDACIAFLGYRSSRGTKVEGLLNRRAHEMCVFARGEYT